jgi:transcriptional regulator with XRE-family HTH domain
MAHDYAAIARQFLRALRHRRSQVAFSRRLGFSSNVAAQWESGRRIPRLLTAFAACEKSRIDVRAALAAFRPSTAHYLAEQSRPLGREPLAKWLEAQRGKETVSSIARRASLSRHQAARFFSGFCEPRLHEFFALIDATTGRLSDLIALLVDIERIPNLARYHAQVAASRRLAFDEPWSSAVLSAVECVSNLKCQAVANSIGRAFGLDLERVTECLRRLEQGGVIQRVRGKYRISAPLVVDTGAFPEGARQLRQHWATVAHQRLGNVETNDVFSYNIFSCSKADLMTIGRLQREHFQRIRAIIAKSSAETVALLNMQLMEWPLAKGPDPSRSSMR